MGSVGRNPAPGGQTSWRVTGLSSAWPFGGLFFSWCLLCWFPVPRLRRSNLNEASFVPSLPDVIPPPLSPRVTMEMAASQTRHDQPGELLPGANPSFAEAAFYRKRKPQTHHQFLLATGSGKQWEELLTAGARASQRCPALCCGCLNPCMGHGALIHVISIPGPCLPSKLSEECSARLL